VTCSAGDVTPVRFLLDEMLSPEIARQLCRRSIDADAVAARPDLVGRADDHVLEIATRETRCLVTANIADFAALDATWRADAREHAGILLVASGLLLRRGSLGAVIAALEECATAGRDPGPGELRFLGPPKVSG
jgi:hypothetical protein